jgi:hypothetical protein
MDIRNFFGNNAKRQTALSKLPNALIAEGVPLPPAKLVDPPLILTSPTPEDESRSTSEKTDYYTGSESVDIPSNLQGIITWKAGEDVPYSAVAAAFDKIAATTSRLEKESILAKLYRAVTLTTPRDLDCIVYLTSNQVFPAYEGLELGIGM